MENGSRRLDTLPSELIWEILQYCYSSDRAECIPKYYSTLNSILLVNRCLRSYGMRLMLREIKFSTCNDFLNKIRRFRSPFSLYANDVRAIKIGRMTTDSFLTEPCVWETLRQSFPFPRLRTFSCWEVVVTHHVLSLFRLCVEIKTLELIWNQNKGSPDFSPWPRLEILRLHLTGGPPMCMYRTVIPSYGMLTTLSVFEESHSSWLCAHLRKAMFPKLRVLNLQHGTSHPRAIYQFIHRHPTLLEVNVSLFRDEDNGETLSFDGLLKLVDGTGTWYNSKDPSSERTEGVVGWAHDTVPPSGTFITFTAFAFTRVPLYSGATDWREPGGSPEPRYTATALALEVEGQDEWAHVPVGCSVTRLDLFLATMAPRFPSLEVLRLGYHADYEAWGFCELMESCAESLKKWSKLRKLAFCWGDMREFHWRAWRAMPRLRQVEPPVNLRYTLDNNQLDNLFTYWSELKEGIPYTLEQMRTIYALSHADFLRMVEDIQDVLHETVNLDDAMDDPHLLMRAWQGYCEREFVMPMMRLLADNCPTLEEIEWYPLGPFFSDYAVRWLWKVYRERNGKDVRTVTGELIYRGSPKGDAPPFEILVGEELDAVIRDRQSPIY